MRGNNGGKFFAVVLVIAVLTYLAVFGASFIGIPNASNMRYGIDIKGGISATLYPDKKSPTTEELKAAKAVIERRLDGQGIFDRTVTIEPDNGRIMVEIPYKPGTKDLDPQKAIDELGKTAMLTFREEVDGQVDANGYPKPVGTIILQGTDVVKTGIARNTEEGGWDVTLKLSSEGSKKFSVATGRLVGKKIAIFMDDTFIEDPQVEQQITTTEARITMPNSTSEEAAKLASTIQAGSLPFKMVAKEINSITPLLGSNALNVAVMAGIVAYILIFIFMLVYYRLPGMIANIALFGLAVTLLLFMSYSKLSLTLPGIAGIILSVGMGVDANIIIFERIKEELRSGKTLGASVDLGFKRAFTAIFDSNITTIISGVVLYIMGTGPIKGFAITLVAGVVISFITAITASREMLVGISGNDITKHRWLYGE